MNPPGRSTPCGLCEHQLRIGDILKHHERGHGVECPVPERERRDVAMQEADPVAGHVSGGGQECLCQVDRDDLGSLLSQEPGVVPFSAPDVQAPQAGNRWEGPEERGSIHQVSEAIGSRAAQLCPGFSVGIPARADVFGVLAHHQIVSGA
jgi:hypothetical protein